MLDYTVTIYSFKLSFSEAISETKEEPRTISVGSGDLCVQEVFGIFETP